MKSLVSLRRLAAAAALAAMGGGAAAATVSSVVIDTSRGVTFAGSTSYLSQANAFGFSSGGAGPRSETGLDTGATRANVSLSVDGDGAVVAPDRRIGRLGDAGGPGTVLMGTLLDAIFSDDDATFLFRTDGGSAASMFGDLFAVCVSTCNQDADAPRSGPAFVGNFLFKDATFFAATDPGVQPAVVPLPASLPLLLAALGALGLRRRRRAA